MITTFLVALAITSAPAEPTMYTHLSIGQDAAQAKPQAESAVQMIQRMLQRYAEAKTLVGKISLSQTANNVTVLCETELQIERPSMIYLRQVYQGFNPQGAKALTVKSLVSDGKRFAYDRPPEGIVGDGRTEFVVARGKPRYVELVTQNGYTQTVQDMYAAERISLVDKSPLLDIAIARTLDLRDLMGKLASMKVYGKVKVNDADVTAIVGDYREDANAPITGSFEAYLNSDYDLVRYVQKQRFAVPTQPDQTVEVISIWNSSLKVDGEVNPALFKDVK